MDKKMKVNVDKVGIMVAVNDGAKSLSDIWHKLGGKGNVSGSTTKKIRALIPEIGDLLKVKVVKGGSVEVKVNQVKEPAIPSKVVKQAKVVKVRDGGKANALARAVATGNPFVVGSLKAIVFEYGAKDFRPLREILTDAANDPRFIAKCPDVPFGDEKSGRYLKAYWQYTMIRGNHPNNHGASDWEFKAVEGGKKNGHDRLVKAVLKG